MSDKYTLHHGDCLEVMAGMEANSIDTVITDPPAGISFMNKQWDSDKGGRDAWIAWLTEVMTECYRVMKPGAMLLCWSIPRTSHWTGMAIENAGFEIRDIVHHIFGSGFPKSLDIGKSLDKQAGAERDVVGEYQWPDGKNRNTTQHKTKRNGIYSDIKSDDSLNDRNITAPATPEAKTWDGYGTALKPAVECWWLAMKPLDGTFAENALKWGCAGLNVDGARVETDEALGRVSSGIKSIHKQVFEQGARPHFYYENQESRHIDNTNGKGRWPANLILSDDPEVTAGFPVTTSNGRFGKSGNGHNTGLFGMGSIRQETYFDTGSVARFFYCAKSSKSERNHGLPDGMTNKHPTVKPLSLMEYLCTLTRTPTGGLVLDPFCGSGTTGVAAIKTGRDFIGIDQDADSIEVAGYRLAAAVEETAVIQMELELDGN